MHAPNGSVACLGMAVLAVGEDAVRVMNTSVIDHALKAGGTGIIAGRAVVAGAVIASAVAGGATVLVPPTVNVKVAANTVFGGVSDRTVRTEGNPVTLTITGDCVFGSLKIE